MSTPDAGEVGKLLKAWAISKCGEDRYWSVAFTPYEAANQIQAGKRGWSLAQVYDVLFELVNRRVIVEQGQQVNCVSRTFRFEAPADRSMIGNKRQAYLRELNRSKLAAAAAQRLRSVTSPRAGGPQPESAPCEGQSQPESPPCSKTDTGLLSEGEG